MKLEQKWSKVVRHYQKVLRLTDWDITTSVGQVSSNAAAETVMSSGGYTAHMMLNARFPTTGPPILGSIGDGPYLLFPASLDQLAAHECIHIVVDPVSAIDYELLRNSEVVKALHHEALEHAIEKLAATIAKYVPSGVK